MNLTVFDLRKVDIEASSSRDSTGSWDAIITETGADWDVRALVSWYTMSVEPFLSRTSTSSRITTSPRLLVDRWLARMRAMSSVENPLSGNPAS